MRVSIDSLSLFINSVLEKKFTSDDAKRIAEVLIFSELSGRPSHGIVRLLPKRFGPGDAEPVQAVEVLKKSSCVSHVKGHGNTNMLVASHVMHEAISLMDGQDMALVGSSGASASTCGPLSYYCEEIAAKGYASIMMAQVQAMMAPFGSTKPLFGTNPIACGLPRKPHPFVFDMGTSAITYGDVAVSKLEGKPLPENCGVDKYGNKTTDPSEVLDGGCLLPFGGGDHKGSGIAMMIELLSGMLVGAEFCGSHKDDGWGVLVFIFRPDLFMANTDFEDRLKTFFDMMREQKTAAGDAIRIPGDSSSAKYQAAIADGFVDLDEDTVNAIREHWDLNFSF